MRLKDGVHGTGPQLEPFVHEEPPDGEGGRTKFMKLRYNKSQLYTRIHLMRREKSDRNIGC
jgi:hypothetical protein